MPDRACRFMRSPASRRPQRASHGGHTRDSAGALQKPPARGRVALPVPAAVCQLITFRPTLALARRRLPRPRGRADGPDAGDHPAMLPEAAGSLEPLAPEQRQRAVVQKRPGHRPALRVRGIALDRAATEPRDLAQRSVEPPTRLGFYPGQVPAG